MFSITENIKIKKSIALFPVSIENIETLKRAIFSIKNQFFISFAVSVTMKMKNYLKKKNQLRY